MKPLSVEQTKEGIAKSLENARELIKEAKLLLRYGWFARAYSLAHLGCEELAKIPLLFRAACDSSKGLCVDWKKLDKQLHSHITKTTVLAIYEYFSDISGNDVNIDVAKINEDIIRSLQSRTQEYNKLKNYSLYTSVRDGKFSKPSEVISDQRAKGTVELAHKFFVVIEQSQRAAYAKIDEIVKSP